MHGTLSVSRYTLLELSRRRVLLVFFLLGFLGIIAIAVGLRILLSTFATGADAGSGPLTQNAELQFAAVISGVLADFGLLLAFGIGMTAIYHDLDSGAAVSIFAKPVSRFAFTAGKVIAAILALVVIVGVLALETRLTILLFGGGYETTIDAEILAVVANMVVVMLLVLALTTWMNNIVAALVAFVYYNVLANSVIKGLHDLVVNDIITNTIAKAIINVVYWLFPHPLTSDIPAALAGGGAARGPGGRGLLATAASGPGDVVWWAFTVLVFAGLLYYSVRRRQV